MLLHICTGLGDAVSEHAPQFLAHCICGEDLLKLNRQKLEYLQVGFTSEAWCVTYRMYMVCILTQDHKTSAYFC